MFKVSRLIGWATLCFFAMILTVATASADVILPEEETCYASSEGDSCETDLVPNGSCQSDECCRLDYGNMDDTGVPGTTCSDCLTCQPVEDEGEDDDGDGDEDGDEDANDGEGDGAEDDADADDDGEDETGEPDVGSSDVGADVGDEEAEGSCAATAQRPGLIHFASLFLGALLLLGTRRRQRDA